MLSKSSKQETHFLNDSYDTFLKKILTQDLNQAELKTTCHHDDYENGHKKIFNN